MIVRKEYRVFLFEEINHNGEIFAQFTMTKEGLIKDKEYSEVFGTEEEAISFCYETDKYKRWIIVPEITFID